VSQVEALVSQAAGRDIANGSGQRTERVWNPNLCVESGKQRKDSPKRQVCSCDEEEGAQESRLFREHWRSSEQPHEEPHDKHRNRDQDDSNDAGQHWCGPVRSQKNESVSDDREPEDATKHPYSREPKGNQEERGVCASQSRILTAHVPPIGLGSG
jgi:hypothetical protein